MRSCAQYFRFIKKHCSSLDLQIQWYFAIVFSFLWAGQQGEQARGQEPGTRREKILSGRSSGETGTQDCKLYVEMNDNHVSRLLHSQFQLQSSFPLSSDAKKIWWNNFLKLSSPQLTAKCSCVTRVNWKVCLPKIKVISAKIINEVRVKVSYSYWKNSVIAPFILLYFHFLQLHTEYTIHNSTITLVFKL